MAFLKDTAQIIAAEAGLFKRFAKLRLAVAGVIVIPSLYSFIYLSSVWDPVSKTDALPAMIVNLDGGLRYNGQDVNLGRDLATTLDKKHTFGFIQSQDEAAARKAVIDGKAAFALIIPKDFSAMAVPGAAQGGGKLKVFASEGNNYTGAGFAKRFAAELGHQVNQTLNEKRWSLVLGASANAKQSLGRLKDGVAHLQAGASAVAGGLAQASAGSSKLHAGSQQLSDAVGQLTGGVKQLGDGLRTLDAKKPAASDLQALKAGSGQLADGMGDLGKGMARLQDGAQKLVDGANKMRDETKGILIVGSKVAAGASQLGEGASQLHAGLQTATAAEGKLAAGAERLNTGVGALVNGVTAINGAASTMASKIPPDTKLDELAAGSGELARGTSGLDEGLHKLYAGALQLSAGLDTLAQALPADAPGLEGSAKGLAASVEPQVEIDAPVANYGAGFAPNFVPVSLWLGAVMTAFVFHLRRLPALQARGKSAVAQMLGKVGLLGGVVVAQALVILTMLTTILGISVSNVPALALTLVLASITFMLIIVALTRAFGDTGKAVALILLILQLSSAGGVFPVELTGAFFRDISPWLPFTAVVKGIRSSMFGAYGHEWASSLGFVGLTALSAFVIATFVGKWKLVEPDEHRPAMDM